MTLTAVVVAALAQASPAPLPAPACETAEHKQFDFWVGYWDVYRGDGDELVANSLIERLYNGCAIRENWMPRNGYGHGGSLNSYRPDERRWKQVYTGAGNGWSEYAGEMQGDAMVLSGTQAMPDGSRTPVRMTYKRLANGSVIQIGEQSADEGKTWQIAYRFLYKPSSKPPR